MSWLFGIGNKGQSNPPQFPVPPPPPGPGGDAGGDGGKGGKGDSGVTGKQMEAYRFDSAALERAAKAAKDLEQSKYAKDALEMTKMQEVTKQKEYEKQIKEYEGFVEQQKVEQIRVQQEEQRKTMAEDAKYQTKNAQLQDQLARKRYDDQLAQQAQMNKDNLRAQEESTRRQEEMKLATARQQAEIHHEKEMKRIEKEVREKAKADRENHDIIQDNIRLEAAERRRTILESITTGGAVIGGAFEAFISDWGKITTSVMGLTMLAAGVYTCKYSLGVATRYVESRLAKPALVRHTTRFTPLETLRHPIKTWKSMKLHNQDALQGIVLQPKLEERLRDIAVATKYTKRNKGFYRHILLYGPPGTGKTMFAKSLASHSGMDYAIMTGGDVVPMGKEGVTAMHKVFDWAQTSRRGLLLFVDEADAFLHQRSRVSVSEELRATLNAFLYRTGEQSKKFMLVLASNQPEQFDWAINDRIDQLVEFDAPGVDERERMIRQYFEKYVLDPVAKKEGRLSVEQFDYGSKCREIAARAEGLSGREIEKMACAWQTRAFSTEDGLLTEKLMEEVVAETLDQHSVKAQWKEDESKGLQGMGNFSEGYKSQKNLASAIFFKDKDATTQLSKAKHPETGETAV